MADEGPFVNGAAPTAADFQLIPWFERAEAYLPYVLGCGFLAKVHGWPRAAALLAAARTGTGPFSDIAADSESLVADAAKLKLTADLPLLQPALNSVAAVAAHAASTAEKSAAEAIAAEVGGQSRVGVAGLLECLHATCPAERRVAAAQLAANHAKVAAFSRRKARLRPLVDPNMAGDCSSARGLADISDALDESLRSIASQLLAPRPFHPHAASVTAASALCSRCGAQASVEASLALTALAENVAVPRDLPRGPARALRAQCRLLAGALSEVARPQQTG